MSKEQQPNAEEYVGPIPIPALKQSISDFEKEELSKPQYEEFSTVKEILSQPERYAVIIANDNFQKMLGDDKGASPPGNTDMGGIAAEGPKANASSREYKMPPERKDELKTALDAAETMQSSLSATEVPVTEALPAAKAPAVFIPAYRREEVDITSPITVEQVGGLYFWGKDSLEVAGYPTGVRSEKLFLRFLSEYEHFVPTPCIVKKTSITGSNTPLSMHTMTPLDFEDMFSDLHKADIELLRPVYVAPRGQLLPSERRGVSDAMDDGLFSFEFSRRAGGHGDTRRDASYAGIDWMYALRRGLELERTLRIDYAALSQGMNPMLVNRLIDDDVSRLDTISHTRDERKLYDINLPAAAGTFHSVVTSMDIPFINAYSKDVHDRSLALAREGFASVFGSSRSISTFGSPEASSLIASLDASQGATWAREKFAFLGGGMSRMLRVDFSDQGMSTSPELRGLAAVATLMTTDRRYLARDSLQTLYEHILAPFFNSASTVVLGNAGQPMPEVGIGDIVRNLVAQPGYMIPASTRFHDYSVTGGRGSVVIRQLLNRIFNNANMVAYFPLQVGPGLFNRPVGAGLRTPFFGTANGVLTSTLGLNTPGGAHMASQYVQSVVVLRSQLTAYVRCLSAMAPYKRLATGWEGLNLSENDPVPRGVGIMHQKLAQLHEHHDVFPAAPVNYAGFGLLTSFMPEVMIPSKGALSFLLYGIDDPSVTTHGGRIDYTESMSTDLPSLYRTYLHLELSFTYKVMSDMGGRFGGRYHEYRSRYRTEIADTVVAMLKKVFVSVDSKTASRVMNVIDADIGILGNAGIRALAPAAPIFYDRNVLTFNNDNPPQVRSVLNGVLRANPVVSYRGLVDDNVNVSGAYTRYEDICTVRGREVDTIYVSSAAVPFIPVRNIAGGQSYIPVIDPGAHRIVSLSDLVAFGYAFEEKISSHSIRMALQAYNAHRINNGQVTFDVVSIDCKTSLKPSVLTKRIGALYGDMHISMTQYSSGRAHMDDFKFSLPEIPVPIMEVPKHLTAAPRATIQDWLGKFNAIDVAFCVDKVTFNRCLLGVVAVNNAANTLAIHQTHDAIRDVGAPYDTLKPFAVVTGGGSMVVDVSLIGTRSEEVYTYGTTVVKRHNVALT